MSVQLRVEDHLLFEDEFALAIFKPNGLMVEPDRNNYPNLLQQVRKYLKPFQKEEYAQHIHRIDRPVSGIVLFAKQRSILKNLSEQFAERRVKKYYEALTASAPPNAEGQFDNWLRKEKKKAIIYDEPIEFAEKALLRYNVKPHPSKGFLWDIELHTGKYHQIRAQLSHAGYPIHGDELYGATEPYKKESIALNGYRLVFFHPISGEEIAVEKRMDF